MIVNLNDLREFDMELARCVFLSMVAGDQGVGWAGEDWSLRATPSLVPPQHLAANTA